MNGGDKNLLLAVRNRLRTALTLDNAECQIEHDEMAPATAGNTYVVVTPAGISPGPRHQTSGGIRDLLYAVDVTVVRRIGQIARDRVRDVYFANVDALQVVVDSVINAIDFDYTTLSAANTLILAAGGAYASYGFVQPLTFRGADRKPRILSGEMYAASPGTGRVALARTVNFGGARRITLR